MRPVRFDITYRRLINNAPAMPKLTPRRISSPNFTVDPGKGYPLTVTTVGGGSLLDVSQYAITPNGQMLVAETTTKL